MVAVDWQQEFTRLALKKFDHPLTLHCEEDKEINGVRISVSREPEGPSLWATRIPLEMAMDIDGDDPFWQVAAMDFVRANSAPPERPR